MSRIAASLLMIITVRKGLVRVLLRFVHILTELDAEIDKLLELAISKVWMSRDFRPHRQHLGVPAASFVREAWAASGQPSISIPSVWRGTGIRRPPTCHPALTGRSHDWASGTTICQRDWRHRCRRRIQLAPAAAASNTKHGDSGRHLKCRASSMPKARDQQIGQSRARRQPCSLQPSLRSSRNT